MADGRRKDRVFPAKSGRNHVLQLIHELMKQPRLPKSPFTDLNAMLSSGLMTIKKRSLVFILSDFISAPGWERTLNLLARRHEVLAIRLWDPRESGTTGRGPDLDGGCRDRRAVVRGHQRPEISRAVCSGCPDSAKTRLQTAFRHAGVEPWSLSTHEDLVRAILRFSVGAQAAASAEPVGYSRRHDRYGELMAVTR